MANDFKKLEAEHAKETKRIYDSAEKKLTEDMEVWTEERLKKQKAGK